MKYAHGLAVEEYSWPVNGGESTNKYLKAFGFEIEIKKLSTNYYVLGAVWNSDKKKPDQSERFIANGFWQNGWTDKFLDIVNGVKIGDRVAIKSSFATRDRRSILRIKAIGTVYSNDNNGRNLKINWDNGFVPFDLEGCGSYRKTIHKVANEDIDTIFNYSDEAVKEDKISNLIIDDLELPARTRREINSINRDQGLVRDLKELYNNQCQICSITLKISNTISYSEVHHIRPLGYPHNGPDIHSNMIVVCPNCHVQLDFRETRLSKRTLNLKHSHNIDEIYINYHNSEENR